MALPEERATVAKQTVEEAARKPQAADLQKHEEKNDGKVGGNKLGHRIARAHMAAMNRD